MAFRDGGLPDKPVWVVLHGGPGSGAQPGLLQAFSARAHRVLAPDQRGAGASRPRGCLAGNNLTQLVADLERLRQHLGIARWSLLAGSWGAVLALAYAERHGQYVERLVLRGAFGLKRREIMGVLRPARHLQRLAAAVAWPLSAPRPLPAGLSTLKRRLRHPRLDKATLGQLRFWQVLESDAAERGMRRSLRHASAGTQSATLSALLPAIRAGWAAMRRSMRRQQAGFHQPEARQSERQAWQKFRIQTHYLLHRGFITPVGMDRAVRHIARQGIPVDWVHGRHDRVCPPANSRHWAHMAQAQSPACVRLLTPHSGHLASEPDMLRTLRTLLSEHAA